MTHRRQIVVLAWAALLALLLGSPPRPGLGQGQEVHGENSSFVGNGVAMVWGVLRGARDEEAQAVLRIAPAGGNYVAVSLEGVDPFSQRRQELLAMRPMANPLDIRTPCTTFADLPRREIHFYTPADQNARRPSLTIYFMGLPDTAPEFTAEATLRRYLDETLAKLLAAKGRTP
jgi:hypothetical protein